MTNAITIDANDICNFLPKYKQAFLKDFQKIDSLKIRLMRCYNKKDRNSSCYSKLFVNSLALDVSTIIQNVHANILI